MILVILAKLDRQGSVDLTENDKVGCSQATRSFDEWVCEKSTKIAEEGPKDPSR